jgi:soluble cytochrome b562
MRVICLSLGLLCSGMVVAEPAIDLEQTMKNMAFQYKQVYQSDSTAQMLPILQTLIGLTEQALEANIAPDKLVQYQQGLHKVLAELKLAQAAALQQDIELARQHLQQVDRLRKDYHKLREVSIWDLLFG